MTHYPFIVMYASNLWPCHSCNHISQSITVWCMQLVQIDNHIMYDRTGNWYENTNFGYKNNLLKTKNFARNSSFLSVLLLSFCKQKTGRLSTSSGTTLACSLVEFFSFLYFSRYLFLQPLYKGVSFHVD